MNIKMNVIAKHVFTMIVTCVAVCAPISCAAAFFPSSPAMQKSYKPIQYSLPKFGHYRDAYGAITEDGCEIRTVEELVREWSSRYLDRSTNCFVSQNMIEKWLHSNYIPVSAKYQSVAEAKKIAHDAALVAYIASEYELYGLDTKNCKKCILDINRISKDNRSLRIFSGGVTLDAYRKKARDDYKKGMTKINNEMRILIQPLEAIHKKEFEKWICKNPQQYAKLKKSDDELEHNILMQAKIDEATHAARVAEQRAAAAEAAANSAAYEAGKAAREARDARNALDMQNMMW